MINENPPKFKVDDRVRITKYKKIFTKGQLQNVGQLMYLRFKILMQQYIERIF